MDEKYCLKWNDFQKTLSGSLSLLKKEEDFFDITLVSDDQSQIKAHKVVLSACSPFFKNILRNNPHQHPLLFLGGISSYHLQLVTDYIYHGEVQVHQKDIDSFLEVAQKLKVSGLNHDEKEAKLENEDETTPFEDSDTESVNIFNGEKVQNDSKFLVASSRSEKKRNTFSSQKEFTTRITDMNELEGKIAELTGVQEDGLYMCNGCGKTSKGKINITRHVELHIEGISLLCHTCGKEFRSKNALRHHQCKCNI